MASKIIITPIVLPKDWSPDYDLTDHSLTTPPNHLLSLGYVPQSQDLDMIRITCNQHYRDVLEIGYNKKMIDDLNTLLSISVTIPKDHDVSDERMFQYYASITQLWELCHVFHLEKGKMCIISTVSQRAANKLQNTIVPDIISKSLSSSFKQLEHTEFMKDEKVDVAICFYTLYSLSQHIAYTQLIALFSDVQSTQKKDSCAIIQLPTITTQPLLDYICYMASMYESCYLVRPGISTSISDMQYLVLLKYRDSKNRKNSKKKSKSSMKDRPITVKKAIQVHNYATIWPKVCNYSRMLSYITAGFFAGTETYNYKMQQEQLEQSWIALMKSIPNNILSDAIEQHNIRYNMMFSNQKFIDTISL